MENKISCPRLGAQQPSSHFSGFHQAARVVQGVCVSHLLAATRAPVVILSRFSPFYLCRCEYKTLRMAEL